MLVFFLEVRLLEVLRNPIFMIVISILLGQLIGRIEVKHIKLGSSATLFIALILSFLAQKYFDIQVSVDKTVFLLSLIGFIVSVGLIASSNILNTMKSYGIKFIILSFFVTASGGLSTFALLNMVNESKHSIIGTYVGALTSSPGLASALELAKMQTLDQSANVGLGYSIAYIPGVLLVILFTQFMGIGSKECHKKMTDKATTKDEFSLLSFMMVILLGILLGMIKITLSDSMTLSLGMTGGVLISALTLGSKKRMFGLSFQYCHKRLSILRDLSLNLFLSIVGLNYGFKAVSAIASSGAILLMIGLITGSISILVGFVVGKYVLKIEKTYLIGGICGGMTSTPGLASALDMFDEEKVVTGYGATYPFALIFMVLITNLLF